VLVSVTMISILTFGNWLGLEVLKLAAILFVPPWLLLYYCLDFWINRSFVFPVEFSSRLARRFIFYSAFNWVTTASMSFYAVDVLEWGFLGSTLVIVILFPLRYLVQKHIVFK
jgi:hypothetical protein